MKYCKTWTIFVYHFNYWTCVSF